MVSSLACRPAITTWLGMEKCRVLFVVGGGRKRVFFKNLPGTTLVGGVVVVDGVVWERRVTVLSRLLGVDAWCMSASSMKQLH